MSVVAETLSRLAVGAPDTRQGLAVPPCPAQVCGEPLCLTLDEALAAGTVRVTGVPGDASVPDLRGENRGDRPLRLHGGDELVGARQNGVLNVGVLAPPKATITVPVSCGEERRGREPSPAFSPSGRTHHASGRAHRADGVSERMRASSEGRSDQLTVWADIEAKAARLAVDCPTIAMTDSYERRAGLQRGLRQSRCFIA